MELTQLFLYFAFEQVCTPWYLESTKRYRRSCLCRLFVFMDLICADCQTVTFLYLSLKHYENTKGINISPDTRLSDAGNLREGLVSSYSIRSDRKSGEQMTDALHFVFLELPRLKVGKDHPEKCLTMLEKIAFAFRHISFLQERPESFSGEFFEFS